MKRANILITVSAFFAVFFAFCGFAIDFSMIISSRSQLQSAVEAAVLAAAGEIPSGHAQATAVSLIEYNKINGIKYAKVSEIRINEAKNAIWVKVSAPAKTYFLSALGISTIEIQAQSAAMIDPYSLNKDTSFVLEHHTQYISPVLIFAKGGPELKITTPASNYKVFTGLKDKVGEIKWVEITCSSSDKKAKEQYFDFDAQCIKDDYDSTVPVAQYIRVIAPFEVEKVELISVAKLINSSTFSALK